jgi:hypothetical protein
MPARVRQITATSRILVTRHGDKEMRIFIAAPPEERCSY